VIFIAYDFIFTGNPRFRSAPGFFRIALGRRRVQILEKIVYFQLLVGFCALNFIFLCGWEASCSSRTTSNDIVA
jgi:hypothetical protein